ncbi:hypothetical protein K402DRAFT_395403 [Aulographum hederae CBS 113979]|uniref:Nitrogen permease regulator 3 n=1 Tax=Aulographum hederae CBS 113979 TaxID=1176131 RepID=A0A6G1GUU7_9PEZI|nr:hypothetical protein K402DRAFT_395403 [Aulographum hederae CBS 113979]
MLSPVRGMNKKRFECGIEGLVFLGTPMYIREDGAWKKRKVKDKEKEKEGGNGEEKDKEKKSNGTSTVQQEQVKESRKPNFDNDMSRVPGFDPAYGHGLVSGAASDAGSNSSGGRELQLESFHVVFVLNPPALEYHLRVEEMYENVVKKTAKSLKLAQASSNYVGAECRKILAMKERGCEREARIGFLWPSIVARSSLANAIAVIYEAISNSKIANLNLDDTLDVSFQIPRAVSTPFVPTATEPQMPGLWLTTTSFLNEEDQDPQLPAHSALLLLEDADILIKEIESDAKEISGPLVTFVRTLTPTKSLQKLSQGFSSNMSFADISFLASRLIYWRRARAIPPLHHNNTYILSPNANMRNLEVAVEAYHRRFPTSPSLVKMLHYLSGKPKPYSTWIPTRAHREVYMEILAWLMRGGWITQLRMFGWVKVSADVKKAVYEETEAEKSTAAAADVALGNAYDTENESPEPESNTTSRSRSNRTSDSVQTTFPFRRPNEHATLKEAAEAAAKPVPSQISALSPQLAAYRSPPRGPPSDAGSASSGQTAIPISITDASPPSAHKPSPLRPQSQSRPTSSTSAIESPSQPALAGLPTRPKPSPKELKTFTPSIIYEPLNATVLEGRWLEHIGKSLSPHFSTTAPPLLVKSTLATKKSVTMSPEERDKELAAMWPVLLKYLDGRCALDEVALREGFKRKGVLAALGELRRRGVLVVVRHW